jgi:hypothetical protein
MAQADADLFLVEPKDWQVAVIAAVFKLNTGAPVAAAVQGTA